MLTIYLICSSFIFSQNQQNIDSMLTVLKTAPDDTNKVDLLLNIGIEYEANKPIIAIDYYKQALEIAHSINKPVYEAYSVEYLGINYMLNLAKYDSAEIYLMQCLKIRKKVLGEKHPDYAYSLNNLAELYIRTGNYPAAEPLYVAAISVFKEVLGEKHPDYAYSLNNLAELYRAIGNYPAAEPLYKESMNICKEVVGDKQPNYAAAINNLALLYYEMNNYQAAEPLFIEAKNIWKEVLGEKSSDYASSLNNLAGLYKTMGKYSEAESLFLKAINIDKEVLGEKHPDYAQSVNNLACLYIEEGKYSSAESLCIESKNVRKEVLGEKHPQYAGSLNNLAKLYYKMGNYSTALIFYLEEIEIINRSIQQNFAFLSEKEKELYFETQADVFSEFYSFALKYKKNNSEITKNVFNNVVKNKGLLLKSSTAMRVAILNSKDTALILKYSTWIDLKKEISKLYSTEISKRDKNPEVLEQNANVIEKELVKGSQVFSDFEKLQNLNWESVKNSLKPNEAAIEFIRFNIGKNNDTAMYCALIITPQSKQPEMVPLFEEKQILDILNSSTGNNLNQTNNLYGTNLNTKESLYKLIWQPIEKYLEGVKTVYYSPDGILHKVSFAAIGKSKNMYLCDQVNLQQVSSTGKIVFSEKNLLDDNFTACVIGGIDYSADSSKNLLWQYLPGTLTEANAIQSKLLKNNIKTNLYSGKEATELTFKKIYDNKEINPTVLHIATHGFFYPDPEQIQKEQSKENVEEGMVAFRGGNSGFGLWQFVKNKNPLMRSGLVLAGANKVWSDPYAGNDNEGVLTAQEVTQLDMTKTKLVVLSACETGLGDIKGSEGVYGLQRAFKMGGVKYIIMSLWQVPDKETVEFMEMFYTKLLKEKNIRLAFSETQIEMRKKYDPYYWAAFVLID